jgi:hypothetical protein
MAFGSELGLTKLLLARGCAFARNEYSWAAAPPALHIRDKETDIFAAFLERWPSLQDAKRARHDTLVAFFHCHNVRRASVIDRRIEHPSMNHAT